MLDQCFRIAQGNGQCTELKTVAQLRSCVPAALYEKVLLYLCCRFSWEPEARSYTKSFMTAMLGCDLRSLNRVLAELRQRKLIQTNRGRIQITDYEGLLQEAKAHEIDSQIDLFYDYIVDRSRPFDN